MLTSLAIRDIVLIERLDLEFAGGLCVLTGETGAGKSILLDARRPGAGRARRPRAGAPGGARGSVSAVFTDLGDGRVQRLLAEHGIEAEDELVLRRLVAADGRSRAFVNDQPISSGLLRRLGELLVEVHGQHEQQALLEPAVQRGLLDHHGGLGAPARRRCAPPGRAGARRRRRAAALAAEVERAAGEEAYWRHVQAELAALAPEAGRGGDAGGEPGAADEPREAAPGARATRSRRWRAGRRRRPARGRAAGARAGRGERRRGCSSRPLAALERARVELEEGSALLERAGRELELEGDRLEAVEERLFALRAAARKHRVTVDGLAALQAEIAARLAGIDAGGERLAAASAAAGEARAAFAAAAAAPVGRRAPGGRRARQGGDGRAAAAQARQGALSGPPDPAAGGRVVGRGRRAGRLRDRRQPRPGARAARPRSPRAASSRG